MFRDCWPRAGASPGTPPHHGMPGTVAPLGGGAYWRYFRPPQNLVRLLGINSRIARQLLHVWSVVLGLMCGVLGCSVRIDDPIALPLDQATIERGRSLAKGLAACGFCHGERPNPESLLVGGRVFEDRYGPVQASNITPAPSGLKGWTWRDLERTMRGSEERAGRSLSRLAHEGYEWLATPDLMALIAYLGTLPPVEHVVPKRSVGFFARNILGFSEGAKEVRGFVPPLDPKFNRAYGRYLVRHVARCSACHDSPGAIFSSGSSLAGGRVVGFDGEERIAPNISSGTLEGIGAWGVQDVVKYLRTGINPEGREVDKRFCPVTFYANAPEEDLLSIARFLVSKG